MVFFEATAVRGVGFRVSCSALAPEMNATNVIMAFNQGSGLAVDAVGWTLSGSVYWHMYYCDTYNNLPVDFSMSAIDQTGVDGNIGDDPRFEDRSSPSAVDWDWHLQTGSPASNTGDPTLDNPDGSRSDMGAFGGPGADDFAD